MSDSLKPDEALVRFILDVHYDSVPEDEEERDLALAEATDRLGEIINNASRNGVITDDLSLTLEGYVYRGEQMFWIPKSHWDEHPDYPAENWRAEVSDKSTRQSYIEWVNNEIRNKDLNEGIPGTTPETE